MKVLFLPGDFYPKTSGGAFVDWNVAVSLVNKGHEVVVVTPRNKGTDKQEQVQGVEIHRPYTASPDSDHPNALRSQLLRIKFLLLVFPYLSQLHYDRSFDIIYSTNHVFHPIAKIIGSVFSVPIVNFVGYSPTLRDDMGWFDSVYLLEQLIFRFCMGEKVLCRTPDVRDELQKHSDATVEIIDGILQPVEIHTAIENSEEIVTFDKSTTTILFVGRLVNIKNPVETIEIVRQLPADYELKIIGDGPSFSEVQDKVRRYKEEDRVELMGTLSHEQTLQHIEAADLLIMPSKTESYGAVVFEALSLKTPVLATPVGILPEISHHRLTLSEVDDFPIEIQSNKWDSNRGIDGETLEQFSISQFTSKVTKSLYKIASKNQV